MSERTITLQIAVTLSVHDLAGLLAVIESAKSTNVSASVVPNSGTDAARAVLAPPAPQPVTWTDCFATDRKGKIPTQAPAGAELRTVAIVAAVPSPDNKHLKVTFRDVAPGANEKANCFDPRLWTLITNQEGKHAALWIVASGAYLNIVGVRGVDTGVVFPHLP